MLLSDPGRQRHLQLLLKTVLDVGGQGRELVTSVPGFLETTLIWAK